MLRLHLRHLTYGMRDATPRNSSNVVCEHTAFLHDATAHRDDAYRT